MLQFPSNVASVNKSGGPTPPTSRLLRQSVHVFGTYARTHFHVKLTRVVILLLGITLPSVSFFFLYV